MERYEGEFFQSQGQLEAEKMSAESAARMRQDEVRARARGAITHADSGTDRGSRSATCALTREHSHVQIVFRDLQLLKATD